LSLAKATRTDAQLAIETSYSWIRLMVSITLSTLGCVDLWSLVVALPARLDEIRLRPPHSGGLRVPDQRALRRVSAQQDAHARVQGQTDRRNIAFVGRQSFAELHDAHRVRWCVVIGQYEFSTS